MMMMMMMMMMMLRCLRVKTLSIFEGSRISRASGMWLKLLKRRQNTTFHMPRTFYCLQNSIINFRIYGPYSPLVECSPYLHILFLYGQFIINNSYNSLLQPF